MLCEFNRCRSTSGNYGHEARGWALPSVPADVERDRLMRAAAKAFHFQIAVLGIERVTQRGRWLRRTLKAEHSFVPRLAGQPVGVLACFRRALCRRPALVTAKVAGETIVVGPVSSGASR
jgi:hypothetical protein